METTKDGVGHERTRLATKQAFDPCVSEWSNPAGVMPSHLIMSKVVVRGTRRELKHLSTSRKRNQLRFPK